MTAEPKVMVEQYDDWGAPVVRQRPQDRGPKGTIVFYWHLLSRKYRTLSTAILVLTLLLWYWSTPRTLKTPPTDWNNYAYVQYVTDDHHLCNAYMIFEALHRHGSKAQRVLMYPEQWDLVDHDPSDRVSQLLLHAQHAFKVILRPIPVISADGKATPGTTENASITKLRAFQLGEYDRVLHIDNDATLLQDLDELFFLPSAPIAMPRAYWSDLPPHQWPLSSRLMLIEPNIAEFDNFVDIMMSWKTRPGFKASPTLDVELLNHRFGSSAMVLPHRKYAMSTSEFRKKDHSAYLGTINGPRTLQAKYNWDADRAIKEAKLVLFNDHPLPKPWIMWSPDSLAAMQPGCDDRQSGCSERTVWKGLYTDFRKRRKDLCKILSVTAPDWNDIKDGT